MHYNLIKKTIVYIVLFLLIVLCIIFKLIPYSTYNYYYLVGFDTGKYIYDFTYKLSTTPGDIDLWVEPGLNTTLLILNTLITRDGVFFYKYLLPIFISINFVIIVFLITSHITKSKMAGLFAAFYISTSNIFINATFDSFYRQMFSTVIFMCFLYFLEKSYSNGKIEFKIQILLSILGAGVIFSHRAVSLLFVLLLSIFFVMIIRRKQFHFITPLLTIVFFSLFFSSVYWITIISDNLQVIKDAIGMSFSGKHGGATTISTSTRADNQIIGYITLVPTSIFVLLGLLYMLMRKVSLAKYFTYLLIIYILVRATFSNRFLINLEPLLAVAVGISMAYFKTNFNRVYVAILFSGLIIINIVFATSTSISRKPYILQKPNSIIWLENNISKEKSIIIAPDALSTILGQEGYKVSIYEYKPKPKGIDSLVFTENFLTIGFNDISTIKDAGFINKDIYVLFGDWNLTNDLSHAKKTIPMDKWDKSRFFEKVYDGDAHIRSVYKLKGKIN